MSAIAIVVQLLKANAGVTTIATAEGIYPITLPQEARPPAILVAKIAGPGGGYLLQGAGKYYEQRISVECSALSPSDAHALDEACLAALEDVLEAAIGDFRDVRVFTTETEWTDHSDDRSTTRFGRHYNVRWRRPA